MHLQIHAPRAEHSHTGTQSPAQCHGAGRDAEAGVGGTPGARARVSTAASRAPAAAAPHRVLARAAGRRNSPVPCFPRAKVPPALALLRRNERVVQGGNHLVPGGALLPATPGPRCRAGGPRQGSVVSTRGRGVLQLGQESLRLQHGLDPTMGRLGAGREDRGGKPRTRDP